MHGDGSELEITLIDCGRTSLTRQRAGKTLIHGGLNLTRPNLRALARSMTDRFAATSEVVAFLTPAGQQGPRTAIQPMSMSSSWKERNGGRSGRRRRSGGRESANRLR